MRFDKQKLVVIGNGMTCHRFCQKMVEFDLTEKFSITIFGDEDTPAYDRINIAEYYHGRSIESLFLSNKEWYSSHDIDLRINERVDHINRDAGQIESNTKKIKYDKLIIATGAMPNVPKNLQSNLEGVLTIRTYKDIHYLKQKKNIKKAIIIGGGVLGVETAFMLSKNNISVTIIELASKLMPIQLDLGASEILQQELVNNGINVLLETEVRHLVGILKVKGVELGNGQILKSEIVIICIGIKPRISLALESSLKIGKNGGIWVDKYLKTSDDNIYAIGDCAEASDFVFGQITPCYRMADILAHNLKGGNEEFFEMIPITTRLKVPNFQLISFGQVESEREDILEIGYVKKTDLVYRKFFISNYQRIIVGAILIGLALDYHVLLEMFKSKTSIDNRVQQRLKEGVTIQQIEISSNSIVEPDYLDKEICICENVSKSKIMNAIINQDARSVSKIQALTNAGTGCGTCVPILGRILQECNANVNNTNK